MRPDQEAHRRKKVGDVLWNATGNKVIGNVVENSGLADIGSGTIPADDASIRALNNCFSDNTYKTSAPENLEEIAPCSGPAAQGDFSKGALDLIPLIADQPAKPKPDAYRGTPVPPVVEPQPRPNYTPRPGGLAWEGGSTSRIDGPTA